MADKFNDILVELRNLHEKKSQDYGTDNDPYANVRASADFGVAPWVGALIRENDKTTRIKSFIDKGNVVNESVEDSLIDKAVYAIIALLLYRETQPEPDVDVRASYSAIGLAKLGHKWGTNRDCCENCGLTGMQFENLVGANQPIPWCVAK